MGPQRGGGITRGSARPPPLRAQNPERSQYARPPRRRLERARARAPPHSPPILSAARAPPPRAGPRMPAAGAQRRLRRG